MGGDEIVVQLHNWMTSEEGVHSLLLSFDVGACEEDFHNAIPLDGFLHLQSLLQVYCEVGSCSIQEYVEIIERFICGVDEVGCEDIQGFMVCDYPSSLRGGGSMLGVRHLDVVTEGVLSWEDGFTLRTGVLLEMRYLVTMQGVLSSEGLVTVATMEGGIRVGLHVSGQVGIPGEGFCTDMANKELGGFGMSFEVAYQRAFLRKRLGASRAHLQKKKIIIIIINFYT